MHRLLSGLIWVCSTHQPPFILRCCSLEIIQLRPTGLIWKFFKFLYFCAHHFISLNVIFCRLKGTRGLLWILIDLWNVKRGMASLIMHLGERSQIWVGTILRLRSYYRLGLKKCTGASRFSIYLFYFIFFFLPVKRVHLHWWCKEVLLPFIDCFLERIWMSKFKNDNPLLS